MIKNAKNIERADTNVILADVQFYNNDEWYQYCASDSDVSEIGRLIYEELKSGKFGAPVDNIEKRKKERKGMLNQIEKNRLLQEADAIIQPMLGYALADILSNAEKSRLKAWNEYRKTLEDVDVTATDIEWPAKPE